MVKESVSNPIYFTKVQFDSGFWGEFGGEERILLLDLVNKELSYQVFKTFDKTTAIIDSYPALEEFVFPDGTKIQYYPRVPRSSGVYMKNGKTGFKSIFLHEIPIGKELIFSHGIKLSDEQISLLKPYCDANEFEKYRNREMKSYEEGYIGYRDEIHMKFYGVSNSHLPIINLPMDYYYDEKHIWPSEKLYRYICENIISKDKILQKYISYGSYSLFFWNLF